MSHRLGSVVRRFRQRAGLTQQQAADLAGMSVAALRDLEQGRVVTPRSATLRRVAEALRLPVGDTEELLRSAKPEQVPASDLWIQVLGPLAVHADGARVEVGSARQRLLLALLGLSPNMPLSQDSLIETLWNQPPANATDLLRINVSRLRRRLPQPPVLVATQGGYQLSVSGNQLDLLMFRRLVDRARQARQDREPERECRLFAEAMALWRADPVADLAPLRNHPAVVALTAEWQRAVVEYAGTATAQGRHDEVLPLLRRVVEADPRHEAAHARLMLALAASGQPATALSTFDTLRDRLAEELGTDPGPELVEAHRVVEQHLATAGDSAGPGPAPVSAYRQLPPDLADFTGRAAELQALHQRLPAAPEGTAVVISSLEGMGGVGKTRLAVHLAHQLLAAGRYPDVQLYVDLHGHADQPPADPGAVLASFLLLLGVPGNQIPADLPGREALFRDQLSGRSALLLLDNAANEEQVRPLLPASPTSLVLVTSRRSLALDGAQVLPLDVFSPAEAESLLARIAGPERVAAEPAATHRIVDLCGRLPLAVSLAARRLRARPGLRLADLADRLAQENDRLGELGAGTRALQAVFDLSYHALTIDERRLFRLLGLHPGEDFSAESVAALTARDPVTARRLLDRLVDEHLATMITGERYRLHDLLLDYAVEVVATEEPEPECRAAIARLLDFYLHTAARAIDRLVPQRVTVALTGTVPAHALAFPDRQAAVRWLDGERVSLLAAVRFAAAHGWLPHAWQLAYELRVYLGSYGHIRDWVEHHEIALQAIQVLGDSASEAKIRTSLGTAYARHDRYLEAREQLVRALAGYRETSADAALETTALNELASAYRHLGLFSEATRHYREAASLCSGRDPYREGTIHGNLGLVLTRLGRLDEARDSLQQALTLHRQAGDADAVVGVLAYLGDVYRRFGRHDDAFACLEEAAALMTDHHLRPQSLVLQVLGRTCRDVGRAGEAMRHLTEALRVERAEGYAPLYIVSPILTDLGAAYRDAGDLEEAGNLSRQGLAVAVKAGLRYQEAQALAGLAEVYQRAGDVALAEDHRRRAHALFAEMGVLVPGQAATQPEEDARAGSAAAPPRE